MYFLSHKNFCNLFGHKINPCTILILDSKFCGSQTNVLKYIMHFFLLHYIFSLERGLFPTGPTPSSFDHNELMPFHQADQDLKQKDKLTFTSNQSGASPAATFYSGWPE